MKTIILIISMAVMTAAMADTRPVVTTTSAEGSGAGNGGNDALAEYQAKLKAEMGISSCGNNCRIPDLNVWCAKITRMLRREMQKAQLQVQYNRYGYASQILKTALVVASESLNVDSDLGGPMTKALIDRGIILNQALEQTDLGSSRIAELSRARFLVKYFELILDVESHLDRPLYIPYIYQYGRCERSRCPGEFQFDEFERKYIQFAKRQLSFVAEEFTEVRDVEGLPEVFPLGNPRAFLVLSELMSSFVAQDLGSNLYAYMYACVVVDLENLSETLRQYNCYGDKTVFPNDRWAINSVRSELDRLGAQMNSCHR